MIGKLLTTSALVIVLSGGAYAAGSMTAPASNTMATSTIATSGYSMTSTDALASKIIGTKVYDSIAQNAKEIGTVKDLVLNQHGDIAAAVVALGGVLGFGEKDVALDYRQLKWALNTDGSDRATLATPKEALNAAPAFKWPDTGKLAMNNNAAGVTTMAPATTSALTVGTHGTGYDNGAITSNSGPAASTAAGAEVDPAKLSAVNSGSMTSDDLKGIDVISAAGVKLGSIGDFVLTNSGQVDAVVVDFGGFLGIGTKQVAIQYTGLKFLVDNNSKRYLEVNVTKGELNAQQAYNKDTFAANRSAQLLSVNS